MKCSFAALVLAGAVICNVAAAADAPAVYPTKPIRLLVPYPPGGSTDPIVRIVGQRMWGDIAFAAPICSGCGELYTVLPLGVPLLGCGFNL